MLWTICLTREGSDSSEVSANKCTLHRVTQWMTSTEYVGAAALVKTFCM